MHGNLGGGRCVGVLISPPAETLGPLSPYYTEKISLKGAALAFSTGVGLRFITGAIHSVPSRCTRFHYVSLQLKIEEAVEPEVIKTRMLLFTAHRNTMPT